MGTNSTARSDSDLQGHTPGPWKVSAPRKDWNGEYSLFEIHWSDAGECIAEFVHGEHDARLIAAAPELLAKLNEVLDFYDTLPSEHAPGEAELLDSITTLLAKTRGAS